jgi:hypothetical protein
MTVAAPTASPTPTSTPGSTLRPPTNLRVVSAGPQPGTYTLSWEPPTNETVIEYQIVSIGAGGQTTGLFRVLGSQSQTTIGGLNPGIGYSLAVLAVDTRGRESVQSNTVSTVGAPTPTPIVPPGQAQAPYGQPPYGGAAPGYPPSQPGYAPGQPGYLPGQPGYTTGQPYAPGQAGYGPATAGQVPSIPQPPITFPTNPVVSPQYSPSVVGGTSLTLSASPGRDSASLTWNPVAGATYYALYRGQNSGPVTLDPVNSRLTGTSALASGLAPGISYRFELAALNANGVEMLRSGPAFVTPTGR